MEVVVCERVDTCSKVTSLLSRDWANDAQFAEAVGKQCEACEDRKHETLQL